MDDYVLLFMNELGSKGIGGILLFNLSSILGFLAGLLFIECFSLRKSKFFNLREAILLPIVSLMLSFLSGVFLLKSTFLEIRIMMVIWIVVSVVLGALVYKDKK